MTTENISVRTFTRIVVQPADPLWTWLTVFEKGGRTTRWGDDLNRRRRAAHPEPDSLVWFTVETRGEKWVAHRFEKLGPDVRAGFARERANLIADLHIDDRDDAIVTMDDVVLGRQHEHDEEYLCAYSVYLPPREGDHGGRDVTAAHFFKTRRITAQALLDIQAAACLRIEREYGAGPVFFAFRAVTPVAAFGAEFGASGDRMVVATALPSASRHSSNIAFYHDGPAAGWHWSAL